MRGPHNIWRLIRTGATFERTGALDVALEGLFAPKSLKVATKVISLPFAWLGLKGDPDLPAVPRALTALGPAYIKFGQILSTRPDIVGEDLAQQMKVLQDKLPPFDDALARAEFEKTFGVSVDEAFSSFSAPIAAASIAQVHKATVRETASASAEFRANTEKDPDFGVPRVIWPYSDRRIFTSEWVEGINIGDVEAVRASGIDLKVLANTIIQSFLNHALNDGFFHADMHQGNLKLSPDGTLIALDFGIMGRIDEYTRRVYAEILIGFIRQDYKRIAEVHFEAGYVPQDQDVDAFAQALRSIGEPIFGQDASQISMARLLAHLFEVTEQFGMATRTELILLQRTMVVVEGVGRSLDPELNLWESAKPVVEKYIRTNIGPLAAAKDLAQTVRVLGRFGPRLPQLAEKALMRAIHEEEAPKKKTISGGLWGAIGLAGGVGLSWVFNLF